MNLRFAVGLLLSLATPALAGPPVTIYKGLQCPCCDNYINYLRAQGDEVTVVEDANFAERGVKMGIPEQGVSCHVGTIGTYVFSGLIPADILQRLVDQKPDITGITLPGMPGNAPGMAPEKSGTLKVYAFGKAGVSVFSDE